MKRRWLQAEKGRQFRDTKRAEGRRCGHLETEEEIQQGEGKLSGDALWKLLRGFFSERREGAQVEEGLLQRRNGQNYFAGFGKKRGSTPELPGVRDGCQWIF